MQHWRFVVCLALAVSDACVGAAACRFEREAAVPRHWARWVGVLTAAAAAAASLQDCLRVNAACHHLVLDPRLQAVGSAPGSDGIALLRCCCAGTADRIVQEGFDMRLVNHASAYGNGTCFSGEGSGRGVFLTHLVKHGRQQSRQTGVCERLGHRMRALFLT